MHIANNFHYYENHREQILDISKVIGVVDNTFEYSKSFTSLWEFDKKLKKLQFEEEKLRTKHGNGLVDFEDDFFNDWFKTFYCFNTKNKTEFVNPILNNLFKKYQTNE